MKKAFTMIELVFIIVIIGILSAIAIPKFTKTAELAYDSKAKSTLAAVMAAVSTERQKRILRGDTTLITDLGDAAYAFNTFDGGTKKILSTPVKNCSSGQRGCWKRNERQHDILYGYRFIDSSSGTANFKVRNNRLECYATRNEVALARCARLLN